MKLWKNYVPDNYKIPSNKLFLLYREYIETALRPPGDRNPSQEKITEPEYNYELTEQELEFYRQLYIPSSIESSLEYDYWLTELFDEEKLRKLKIGINERQILDYLRGKNERLIILKSPIGWGKTALIKYIFFYLIGESSYLTKHIYPIYLCIDQEENKLDGLNQIRAIRKVLYDEFLTPRLSKVVSHFSELSNEKFWDYIKNKTDDFGDLLQEELDINSIYSDLKERDRYIKLARMKARKKIDFNLCAAQYMAYEAKKIPIIIFDNVDPLSFDVHKAILNESIRISEQFNLWVIISMRDKTYDALYDQDDGVMQAYLPIKTITLEKRSISDYIKERVKATKSLLKNTPPKHEYIDLSGKKYIHQDAEDLLIAWISILLSDECGNFLDCFSYHNLRMVNELVKDYLSSGFLEEHHLNKALIEERVEKSLYKSPFWILLTSIITNNHKTIFSSHDNLDHGLHRPVLNLYCNNDFSINPNIIRTHILNFASRKRTFTPSKILEDYSMLFLPKQHVEVKSSLARSLKRLLDCKLLVSPDYYKINTFDVFDKITRLELTDTGDYYLSTLSGYFEYILFMKDDIYFTEDNKPDFKDCIQVTDREKRYESEVFKFITYLVEKEISFFSTFNEQQKKVYIENFSSYPSDSPYITISIIEKLITFGKIKNLNINNYQILLNKVLKNTNNF